ncbi:MAG TPA: hypothetical protein VGZ29_14855 [Terriglobia bacterium]|nr:hypothetical protein [Terriglobia bacterium]
MKAGIAGMQFFSKGPLPRREDFQDRLDISVLLDAGDRADPKRQRIAIDLTARSRGGVLRWQVACGFCALLSVAPPHSDAENIGRKEMDGAASTVLRARHPHMSARERRTWDPACQLSRRQ